jgi:Carbohydrate binding domain
LMFSARATGNRTIRVAFQRNSAPYPVYIEKTFSVTTAWQTYTLTFTPTTTDAKTLFNFNLGIATGSVWIDDVTLSP